MNQYTLLRIKERMNKELYDSMRTHITIDGTMTRKEEIWKAICDLKIGSYDENNPSDNDKYDGSDIQSAFYAGAMWSDTHPKSHWISVKDDLPYKHKELISPDDKRDTKCVFTLINGCISLNMMYKLDGKWHWKFDEPTHWFSIPELPKE